MLEPRLDHWHSLREFGRVCRALEEDAYRRLRLAERSQKAAQIEAYRAEHRGRRPHVGAPLKAPSDPQSVAKALAGSAQAISRFDSARLVFEAVAEALGPIDLRTDRVRRPLEVLADLGAAVSLLRELSGLAAHAARVLEERAESLDKVVALFKVYRNHHVFSRGKRAGQSPLELLGLPSPHWLDVLGYPKSASGAIPPTNLTKTVNTLAA